MHGKGKSADWSIEPITSSGNVNDDHFPPAHQNHSAPTKFTRVDGKGLWRSWKRNFKTKLLALLDLIDNSVDAAIACGNDDFGTTSGFIGRVHIYPDVVAQTIALGGDTMDVPTDDEQEGANNPSARISPDGIISSSSSSERIVSTGLAIVNNSIHPIRPLEQVLEVYNSSKIDSGGDHIGENGVGLKQGCATLSDLSFVLVKNGEEEFVELGIVSESLQQAEGCYLPAFRFSMPDESDNTKYLETQMLSLFQQASHRNVAKCIEQYGSALYDGTSSNLQKGIDRLCKHFSRCCFNFYNNQHVFAVILDNMCYGKPGQSTKQVVAEPLKDLRLEIPRTYLHIPNNFDFRVGRERIKFESYWPQRLVEFSSFAVNVSESVPWNAHPWNIDEPSEIYMHSSYGLRVFCGFDRVRLHSNNGFEAPASLYVYSRQSGRLVKHEPDARLFFGMQTSGTKHCSGFTILIDDIEGRLPLNPTKQDIAFAEQANGDVHKANLYTWVGAIAKFYYQYHINKYNNRKSDLTSKIKEFGVGNIEAPVKTIDQSQFTTFNVRFKPYANRTIRSEQASAWENVGPGTHFRLLSDPQVAVSEPPAKRKKHKAIHVSETLSTDLSINSQTQNDSETASATNQLNRIMNTRPVGAAPQQQGITTSDGIGFSADTLQPHTNSHWQNHHRFHPSMQRLRTNGQWQSHHPYQQQHSMPHSQPQYTYANSAAPYWTGRRNQHPQHPIFGQPPHSQLSRGQPGHRQQQPTHGCYPDQAPSGHGVQIVNHEANDVSTVSTAGGSSDQSDQRLEADSSSHNTVKAAVNDDEESVSSSKDHYKSLCEKLTIQLEKKKDENCYLKKEIERLQKVVLTLQQNEMRRQSN